MNILEKEIEDLIWYGINNCRPELRKKGFWVADSYKYFRQVELGSYGRADIVGFDVGLKSDGYRYISFHVIEAKKECVNASTLIQAGRYCKAIQRIVRSRLIGVEMNFIISLVGKTVDKSDFIYLTDVVNDLHFYSYSIDFLDGIRFQHERHYYQTDEQFPDMMEWEIIVKNSIKSKVTQKMDDIPF